MSLEFKPHETLAFDEDENRHCYITAVYAFTSGENAHRTEDFISLVYLTC